MNDEQTERVAVYKLGGDHVCRSCGKPSTHRRLCDACMDRFYEMMKRADGQPAKPKPTRISG